MWGQALHDLSLSICITGAKAPPRHSAARQWLKLLQGAHTAPACFRLTQPPRGTQVTDPPGKELHRNPIQQQHCRKAAQSLRGQLHSGTGTAPVRLVVAHGFQWEAPAGGGNLLFFEGAPVQLWCAHLCWQKGKRGKDCSFISAMLVSRPRRGCSDCPNETCSAFHSPALNAGMEGLEVLCKYQKRKVTGQEHRLTAIWNQIIWVTEGKLPQEMAWIPDLWFCQNALHKRQSSWVTVARLSLSDKAISTAVSPQHLPVRCFFRFKTRIPAPQWCSEEMHLNDDCQHQCKCQHLPHSLKAFFHYQN